MCEHIHAVASTIHTILTSVCVDSLKVLQLLRIIGRLLPVKWQGV